MIKQSPWIKTTQFPSVIIAGALVLLVAYFALLSPSSLEDDFLSVRVVHPKELLNFLKDQSTPVLAQGVPHNEAPAYSLRNFDFFSTTDNSPDFRFTALKSNFYQKEQLIHAKTGMVYLNDGTVISSKEFLFETTRNEIHFFGDVLITFENGAVVRTNYMKAVTRPIQTINVPTDEPVSGEKREKDTLIKMKAFGMHYTEANNKSLRLLKNVVAVIIGEHTTEVQSDVADMDFNKNKLVFKMSESKPFEEQFVLTHREQLEMKSRTLQIDLEKSALRRITAMNDVSIREKSFYSTSGKANFDEPTNTIELWDFPQVYQESDTITGDVILYHRNDDTIEVKQSNAIYKHQ